jgi:hypothetical protein
MITINSLKNLRNSEYFKGFEGLNGPTPIDLCLEQIKKLNLTFSDPMMKFLFPAAGHGTYAYLVYWKLMNGLSGIFMDEEKRSRHIIENMLYLNEINPWLCRLLRKQGFINVIEGDYLNYETEMKFDVILGNSPYLKGVWRKFLKKSTLLSKRYINIVSPDATKTFSTRSEQFNSFLADNGLQSITPCTHYFPNVNSGEIVYYFLDKDKEFNNESIKFDKDITDKIEYFKNNFEINLNAILSNKRSKKHTSAPRFEEEIEGTVLNLESITIDGPIYKYINPEHTHQIDGRLYWLTNRYFGKSDYHNTPLVEINGFVNISSNILAIERIPNMTLDEFKKIYLSTFFREFLTKLRGGGFDTSPRHLKQLPVIYSLNELSENIF